MKSKQFTSGLFAIYLLYLIWVLVFKMDVTGTLLQSSHLAFRSLNLTLFAGTAIVDGHLDYLEIGWNVLAFLPLGIYLKVLWSKSSEWFYICAVFSATLLIESIQYIFGFGVADITDLAANSLGGFIGLITYSLLEKSFKGRTLQIVNWLGLILTTLFLYLIHIRGWMRWI